MFSRYTKYCTSMFFLCGLLASPAHAIKTDVVVLINGNAVTGEVKSLEFGSLRYSTDSMGTVSIDWEDVVTLASKQSLQIEVTDGSRYYGTLLVPDDKFHVRIQTVSQEISFPAQQVVRITPIETSDRFIDRLEGNFSLGYQQQKSSGITSTYSSADVRYRTRKYLVGLRMNTAVTDQPSIIPSERTKARQSVELNYQRFRPNRWFTDWFTSWETNDELGINSRVSLGGAVGRYFVQSNKNQFSVAAGVQGARQSFIGEDESTTDAEGRIEIRYLRRKLTPETSIAFTSKIYPLLEDLSQYRAESDLSLKREFIEDLFLEINVGYSYLSDPPTDAASTDYAITTSVGYSF